MPLILRLQVGTKDTLYLVSSDFWSHPSALEGILEKETVLSHNGQRTPKVPVSLFMYNTVSIRFTKETYHQMKTHWLTERTYDVNLTYKHMPLMPAEMGAPKYPSPPVKYELEPKSGWSTWPPLGSARGEGGWVATGTYDQQHLQWCPAQQWHLSHWPQHWPHLWPHRWPLGQPMYWLYQLKCCGAPIIWSVPLQKWANNVLSFIDIFALCGMRLQSMSNGCSTTGHTAQTTVSALCSSNSLPST